MPHALRRRAWNLLAIVGATLATGIVLIPLAHITATLVIKGLPGLNAGFFLHMPKPVGENGGGMANAIVGTLIVVGLGALFALPVGIGGGLYLSEHGEGRLAAWVRYTAEVLGGVPSIVIGVVAYGLLVVPMQRFSAIAGGLALGILMLPTILRSTEEVVRLVPHSYREAALALGAPRWRVTLTVVVPAAAAGITTAVLLSLARAAGETAPLLFTALGNRFFSLKLDRPMASLPVMIYDYARAPYEDWNRQAWTGALVLLMVVTVLSWLVRASARRLGGEGRT